MRIRKYKKEDCLEIVKLFYNTIHSVNAKDYNKRQLEVWAPEIIEINLKDWNKSLSEHYTIIVEDNNKILGFGDIDHNGYLDRLFVHKNFQGQGITSKICNELEQYTKHRGITILTTEASITAKHFFEKRGYKVIKEQQVERKGGVLTNYLMEKNL